MAVLAVKPEQLNFVYKFEGFDTKTQRLLIQCFRELIYRTNAGKFEAEMLTGTYKALHFLAA